MRVLVGLVVTLAMFSICACTMQQSKLSATMETPSNKPPSVNFYQNYNNAQVPLYKKPASASYPAQHEILFNSSGTESTGPKVNQ